MEILNINKDAGITRIQTAGGIVFVRELWMGKNEKAEAQLQVKYEAAREAIKSSVAEEEYICEP